MTRRIGLAGPWRHRCQPRSQRQLRLQRQSGWRGQCSCANVTMRRSSSQQIDPVERAARAHAAWAACSLVRKAVAWQHLDGCGAAAHHGAMHDSGYFSDSPGPVDDEPFPDEHRSGPEMSAAALDPAREQAAAAAMDEKLPDIGKAGIERSLDGLTRTADSARLSPEDLESSSDVSTWTGDETFVLPTEVAPGHGAA